MPQPMPPPGGPPAQGGDASGPQQAQQPQGGGVAGMIMTMDKAIDHLAQVVNSAPDAPPAMKQLIGQIDQLFGKFMDMAQGGGQDQEPDDEDQGQGQGQTVPPEAAGNKGAIPHP